MEEARSRAGTILGKESEAFVVRKGEPKDVVNVVDVCDVEESKKAADVDDVCDVDDDVNVEIDIDVVEESDDKKAPPRGVGGRAERRWLIRTLRRVMRSKVKPSL